MSNFSKIARVIHPKNRRKQTNKNFVLKLISFKGGQVQISQRAITNSGQQQNNTFNDAMTISINRVIT